MALSGCATAKSCDIHAPRIKSTSLAALSVEKMPERAIDIHRAIKPESAGHIRFETRGFFIDCTQHPSACRGYRKCPLKIP